jgi:D-alanine-D-alanine ligase
MGIDKSGQWLLNDESKFLLNADDPKRIRLNPASDSVALIPQSGGVISNITNGKEEKAIDVVFPILHGPFGEDGTVQGLLKLADLPFVGAGVLGSAVGMDKDVMKRLLRDAGIPIGKFMVLRSHEAFPPFKVPAERLGLPLFVKPANMGSSVGVSKVHDAGEYEAALGLAFEYDTKIILEEFIRGRELECSVLGSEPPAASLPGEVVSTHEFYSYDAKYLDEKGAALEIPAKVPAETAREIQELAVNTFQTLSCEGLARVDFFLKADGGVLVNEINTMPGFTKISMYPKLWEAGGISYSALIDTLIELAIQRFNREKKLKTSYI